MARWIGATTSTVIDPGNFSDDPHYAYRPLSAHAADWASERRRGSMDNVRLKRRRNRRAALAAA